MLDEGQRGHFRGPRDTAGQGCCDREREIGREFLEIKEVTG